MPKTHLNSVKFEIANQQLASASKENWLNTSLKGGRAADNLTVKFLMAKF